MIQKTNNTTIKNLRAADNNIGHVSRQSLLIGSTTASWGIFNGEELVGMVQQEMSGRHSGGMWDVLQPVAPFSRIPRMSFVTAKQAKAWAIENL